MPLGQHDIGAFVGEQIGRGAPDALAGSRDDGGLALKMTIKRPKKAPGISGASGSPHRRF